MCEYGDLQGDPLIFNFVMNVEVRNLEDRIGGTLGGTKISQLLFADDAVLFGETLDGLQQNVDRFSESLASFGLSLNAAVHIRVDRRAKKWFIDSSAQLKVSGDYVRTMGIGEAYNVLHSEDRWRPRGAVSTHENPEAAARAEKTI